MTASISLRDTSAATAAHLLNRLGYGPRPGDIDAVRRSGAGAFIDEQLSGALPEPAVSEFERTVESIGYSPSEIVLRHQRKDQSFAVIECMLDDLRTCKLVRAVAAANQLTEVLTDFWYNHFNVYAYAWAPSIAEYERETIRPNVLGKFSDLLRAVAKSPAMMYSLDTFVNTADRVEAGKIIKGVNENFGRELLELHTVGVTAGYSQHDVFDAARCFTGWDFGGWLAPVYEFRFASSNHDRRPKSVFGLTVPAGGNDSDGDALIDYLAAHPKTAQFVSWRLAQRFVSDDPPERLVAACTQTFQRTDGDLRAVLYTMFHHEDFVSDEVVRSKMKTPLDYAASAIRAVNGSIFDGMSLARLLGTMGMPLFGCKPPTGYSNRGTDWINVSSQLQRFNLAMALAAGTFPGVKTEPAHADAAPRQTSRMFRDQILGGDLTAGTQHAIASLAASDTISASRKTWALLLSSPEFQKR